MTLNISTVPVSLTNLAWVSHLYDTNIIQELVISRKQSEELFSSANKLPWSTYKGIPLRII